MRVILEVIAGPEQGRKLAVDNNCWLRVGRTNQADEDFPNDPQMSGVHFAIRPRLPKCELRDMQSSNGLFVNGQQVGESSLLADGDEILAGRTVFQATFEGVPAAPASEPAAPQEPTANAPPEPAPPLSTGATRTIQASDLARSAAPMQKPSPERNLSPKPYRAALTDEVLEVRQAALRAAAWSRAPWLLNYCRSLPIDLEHWDGLLMLAILGGPEDLEKILAAGRCEELGLRRFHLLGAYGHPGAIRDLLQGIASKDPAIAIAAGAAFSRITAADIEAEDDADLPEIPEEENEWIGAAVLPDPQKAKDYWRREHSRYASQVRWLYGVAVDGEYEENALREIDLQSRWRLRLRLHFHGRQLFSPVAILRFPQSGH